MEACRGEVSPVVHSTGAVLAPGPDRAGALPPGLAAAAAVPPRGDCRRRCALAGVGAGDAAGAPAAGLVALWGRGSNLAGGSPRAPVSPAGEAPANPGCGIRTARSPRPRL